MADCTKQGMKVFEGIVEYNKEDSGQALIATISNNTEMFVRIQSWDENCLHKDALQLEGKKVKVTIEIINDV